MKANIIELACLLALFSAMPIKVGAQTSEPVTTTKNRLTIAAGASGQWILVPHGYNEDKRPVTQKQRNAIGWNVPVKVGFGFNNSKVQFMVGVESGRTWTSSEHTDDKNFLVPQTTIEKLQDGTFGLVFGPKLTFEKITVGIYGHNGTFSTQLRRYIGYNEDTPQIQLEDFTRLGTRYYGASIELAYRIAKFSSGRLDVYANTGFKVSSFGSSLLLGGITLDE